MKERKMFFYETIGFYLLVGFMFYLYRIFLRSILFYAIFCVCVFR